MKNHPKKRNVNSIDVARLVGLSRTTVSYVLNGRSDVSIPEATRARVLSAAAKLGYRPNGIARSLVRGKTSTIGVIIPAIELSSTADIVNGIERECSQKHFRMLLAYSHNDPDIEMQQAQLLLEHRVDGIICVVGYRTLSASSRWIAEANQDGVPCVVVDSPIPGASVDYVVGDDRNGAMAAVSHLLQFGHKRIAHLSAGERGAPACERREGYCQALSANGLPVDKKLILGNSFEPAEAAESMTALLDSSAPPTAIFAADDLMAAAAIGVIKQRGLRVPQDIAVVGFNDITLAHYLGLTTVRLSAEDRGRVAIERIFDRLKNPELAHEGIIVPTQLVVRESCGAGTHSAAQCASRDKS